MLSNQLKKLRKQTNITQKDFSKVLSIAPTTYNAYEKNVTEPSIDTLIKIADFFNISLDELVGRDFAQAGTEIENELLKTVKQLSLVEQAKVLGYAKARIEAQTEIKDIKVRTGYKG